MAKYLKNMVTRERVERGAELLVKHSKLLSEVEREYGVPAEIIVSIWGRGLHSSTSQLHLSRF